MAVSSTKYAEIVLDNSNKKPTPRQRTSVKYSQIMKTGQKATSDHSTDSSSAGESAERVEEVMYDVPPSSIASRVVNPLAELPPANVFDNNFLPPLPPKEPTNPFLSETEISSLSLDPSQDPFTGFEMSFPSSFDGASNWNNEYAPNKPPPMENMTSDLPEEADGSIYRDSFNTDKKADIEDSLDVTGGSAYNDPDELIAIQRRRAEELEAEREKAERLFAEGEALIGELSEDKAPEDRGVSPEYDLPPIELEIPSTVDSTSNNTATSPYDFPAALGLHPRAEENRPSSTDQPAYEAPPSDLVKYSAQRQQQQQQHDEEDNKSRPLPPLPPSHPHSELPPLPPSLQELPPLPPSQPHGFRPVGRTSSLDSPAGAPPLPPPNPTRTHSHAPTEVRRNTTWTNGPPASDPIAPRNPPPRLSPAPPSTSAVSPTSMTGQNSPVGAPRRHHDRENQVMDLVKQGYSRADVVKAMAISQNNPDLARLILEGFGSRM